MQIERRFVKGGNVRAKKDGKPGIAGVAAVYTQEYDTGWFVESIAPGAFSRALKEKQDVRCLFNHDVSQVLGRTKSGTLRLEDSTEGLKFECDTDPATRVGVDVPAMIDRGDVDGCSFSFNVRKQTWSDVFDDDDHYVKSIRIIDDLDLFDVGPVTFPAYTDTTVDVRSLWPLGIPHEIRSHVPELGDRWLKQLYQRAEDKKTKRVDGEDLEKSAFAYQGSDELADWKLPIKFSTAEKTESHIRNAIARWSKTDMPNEAEKKRARGRIKAAAKEHDIELGEDSLASARADSEKCECDCDPCVAGNCEDCTNPDCEEPNCLCDAAQNRALLERARAHVYASLHLIA